MKTIVAAIDFSDVTDSVVSTATEFADALGGRVVLFHVAPAAEPWVDTAFDRYSVGTPPNPHWAEVEARHRASMLEQICDGIRAAGIASAVHVAQGDQSDSVCAELASLHPDLIVVGSHRHGMFHDLVAGGVCPRVVRAAPCPVVVVHPGDPVPRPARDREARHDHVEPKPNW